MPTILNTLISNKSRRKVIFVGDSLTRGTGTTGYPSGNGAGPVEASDFCYPRQTYRLLGDVSHIDYQKFGYPGLSTSEIFSTYLATIQANIFKGRYRNVVVVIFTGANDINQTTAASIQSSLVSLHTSIRASGAKTVCVPILNRKDSLSNGTTNSIRNTVNTWLSANWQSFADGYSGTSQSLLYADTAPDNVTYFTAGDVDGFSKVHLSNAGAGLLAAEVVIPVQKLLI